MFKKDLITSIDELSSYVEMSDTEKEMLTAVSESSPFMTTKYYVSLIDKDDPNCPLRKLQIPTAEEMSQEGDLDTSGEKDNTKLQGLQHKYDSTALILSTNACAMYCRYCFRKRLVGLSNAEVLSKFDEAIEYIKQHKEINNVLISGGDSFFLPTYVIKQFLEKLSSIDHVDFIRFGTRIPVVLPDRISEDEELLSILRKYSKSNKRIYIVTQFNHPRELTEESIRAINALQDANCIINNQTVLLRGINDNSDVLADLMNGLVKNGVNPYYVFQCRPVKGVKKHFQLPFDQGIDIVENARVKLNGHSKRFKFIMSHKTGKIEILGKYKDDIMFKYYHSPMKERIGKIFTVENDNEIAWLDEINI